MLVSLGTALCGHLLSGSILAVGDEVSLLEGSPWVFLCAQERGLQGVGDPRLPGLAQVSSAGELPCWKQDACCLLGRGVLSLGAPEYLWFSCIDSKLFGEVARLCR